MSAGGRVLNGRYRLERLLGGGGFADVYLATDLGPLGRRVAVKLLHPHLLRHQDFLERFRCEAGTIAQLKHPHILDVYDFGEADGTLYLVMPYVAGGTLGERLQAAGQFTTTQAAMYLRQIAGALDYAHARRIVHRDLKPQNFLLDDDDNLLLADFGIAKLLQEASQSYSGSAVIGTLPYMAPELFRGLPVPASDQYALGCMVFQFLTGATPYTGTTEQLMFAHNFEPVPTLAERGGIGLPAALEPVLARVLAKRTEERYASVGEFARAFDVALADPEAVPQEAHQAKTQPGGYGDRRPLPLPGAAARPQATVRAPSAPVRHAPRWPWGALGVLGVGILLLALLGATLVRGQGAAVPTATSARVAVLPVLTVAATATRSVLPTVTTSSAPTSLPVPTLTLRALPIPTASPSIVAPTAIPLPFTKAFAILTEHQARVTALSWSPDNRFLASASEDNTVRIWGLDGRAVVTLSGHTSTVLALAWSADGRTLASGSADKTVRLWSIDGWETSVLTGHTAKVTRLSWPSEGRMLASASSDGTVRLWDTDAHTATILGVDTGGSYPIMWSPNGRTLASASSFGRVSLWATDGRAIATLTGHFSEVYALAWTPNSKVLASGGYDGTVRLWDADGRVIANLTGHSGWVSAVAWSPDGDILVSGSIDGTVRWWGVDGRPITTLPGYANVLAWSPDGRILACASRDDNAVQLRGADGHPIATLSGHTGGVVALAWSLDGHTLASASEDGTVRLWR